MIHAFTLWALFIFVVCLFPWFDLKSYTKSLQNPRCLITMSLCEWMNECKFASERELHSRESLPIPRTLITGFRGLSFLAYSPLPLGSPPRCLASFCWISQLWSIYQNPTHPSWSSSHCLWCGLPSLIVSLSPSFDFLLHFLGDPLIISQSFNFLLYCLCVCVFLCLFSTFILCIP